LCTDSATAGRYCSLAPGRLRPSLECNRQWDLRRSDTENSSDDLQGSWWCGAANQLNGTASREDPAARSLARGAAAPPVRSADMDESSAGEESPRQFPRDIRNAIKSGGSTMRRPTYVVPTRMEQDRASLRSQPLMSCCVPKSGIKVLPLPRVSGRQKLLTRSSWRGLALTSGPLLPDVPDSALNRAGRLGTAPGRRRDKPTGWLRAISGPTMHRPSTSSICSGKRQQVSVADLQYQPPHPSIEGLLSAGGHPWNQASSSVTSTPNALASFCSVFARKCSPASMTAT